MPLNSEDTAQLSGSTETSNISSPPPSSASAPVYGTFDPQPRNEDRPRSLSCLKSSLKACFKICLNGYGDDDDGDDDGDSSTSYSLSEGSSTPYPSSLSSEDSFIEMDSFHFEDQSSDSEATLEETRPRKDLGYKSHEPMRSSRNGRS